MIERITDPSGPPPQGPYSHAVKAGGFIYVSGQASIEASTGQFVSESVAGETRRTIGNVQAILRAAGADLGDVVKCSVFLSDIRDFKDMNEVYNEVFGDSAPARSTVQAALVRPALLVEIEALAVVGDD